MFVVFEGHVRNQSHYIFPIRMDVATKCDKMVTSADGLP